MAKLQLWKEYTSWVHLNCYSVVCFSSYVFDFAVFISTKRKNGLRKQSVFVFDEDSMDEKLCASCQRERDFDSIAPIGSGEQLVPREKLGLVQIPAALAPRSSP